MECWKKTVNEKSKKKWNERLLYLRISETNDNKLSLINIIYRLRPIDNICLIKERRRNETVGNKNLSILEQDCLLCEIYLLLIFMLIILLLFIFRILDKICYMK